MIETLLKRIVETSDEDWYDFECYGIFDYMSKFSEGDWNKLIEILPLRDEEKNTFSGKENSFLFDAICEVAPLKVMEKGIIKLIDTFSNEEFFNLILDRKYSSFKKLSKTTKEIIREKTNHLLDIHDWSPTQLENIKRTLELLK